MALMIMIMMMMMMMMMMMIASPWLETSTWWQAGTERQLSPKLIVVYVEKIGN